VHPLNLLLVSQDMECAQLWDRAGNEVAIAVEALRSSNDAKRRLLRQKYNAVVVDFEREAAPTSLLDEVRKSPNNGKAIIVAMVNNTAEAAHAFRAGASICVEKRLSIDWVRRCLRAAHQTMREDRRRNARYAVHGFAVITLGQREHRAKLVNLSENGVGAQITEKAEVGTPARVRFSLPGSDGEIHGTGRVAWCGPDGRIGVHVRQIEETARRKVQQWLRERLQAEMARVQIVTV
jgi:DNA-binding response OmpR family regulator